MTDKEKTAAIAFFSNLVDHDAEAWGYKTEIPLFKTALEALTARDWTPCAEGLPNVQTDVHVTVETENGSRYRTEAYIHRFFKKWHYARTPLSEVIGKVIAWCPYPDHYNPDNNANGKVDEPRSKHTLEMAEAGLSGFVKT